MDLGVEPAVVERVVTRPIDPLEAVPNLVDAWGRGEYVVYEEDGVWFAGFGIDAEVWVDATGAHLRSSTSAVDLPLSDSPFDQVGALLGDLVSGPWTALGWVSFEAGRPGPAGSAGRVVHLVVPRTQVRLSSSGAVVRGPDHRLVDRFVDAVRRPRPAPSPGGVAIDHEAGAAEYMHAVELALSAIRSRTVDKVVLSRVVPVESDVDLVATYAAGRRLNSSPRSVLLSLHDVELAAFCPETVVTVAPSGALVSEPVAGTRACPPDPSEAARLRSELRSDPKEVYEHAISIRAMLEDLREVCAGEGPVASDLLSVRRRGAVQHLATRVSGHLARGRTAWDAFRALFPAVTATGVPPCRARALIEELEPAPRGLYGGAALRVEHDGTFDAALILRAVLRRGGRTCLRAGGGIVPGSTPERELEETREKLRGVAGALVARRPGRTVPPDPDQLTDRT
jgi:salicylate synthetase